MKQFKLLLITFIAIVSVLATTQVTDAAGYYYKWKGYSGNSYKFVTSKAFKNAVTKGKVTVNGYTTVKYVDENAMEKSAEDILEYSFENRNLKSKYIKRKYDTVILLNDHKKVIGIEMPVKKGKITKKQFIKTYGKKYGETQFVKNEISVVYKYKNHYFEGVFNKKNQLINITFSPRGKGEMGKMMDEVIFGE